MRFFSELTKGIVRENPIFRLVLGMCPTLAVTTSLENALGMGAAATFVLMGSNTTISLLRRWIPAAVRIPCYIVLIATFVTVADLLLQAYLPALAESLGIFIPLIVVNCIILGRAEAFAAKHAPLESLADAIGMGIGFTLALGIVAGLRELLGNGTLTLWGSIAWEAPTKPILLFILPAGGFIMLGLILAVVNALEAKIAQRKGKPAPLPPTFDCRHCTLCDLTSR